MIKFHQIPTENYKPLSFENSYLFNHYDKISNFIALQMGPTYKSMIAKPIINEFNIEWYSKYNNLSIIDTKNKIKQYDNSLHKYWKFIDILNEKINYLTSSSDQNEANWAHLLKTVFNPEDNILFSNGEECCIIWGWKFENKELYRPNLGSISTTLDEPFLNEIEKKDSDNDDAIQLSSKIEEVKQIPIKLKNEKTTFLEFLKWFSYNYWWTLIILMSMSILILLIKILYYNI
jgi:hypothetical protein